MNCIKCGKILDERSSFCPQCGKHVTSIMGMQKYSVKEEKLDICKKCGTKSQGGRYCGQCGTELSERKFVEKGGMGIFTGPNKNGSLNGVVNYIKEKCTAGKKVDIKSTLKHGAVFSVCMLMFTLLFILVVQKSANMLPVFQNKFLVKNPGLRNIKRYVLAAMYGLEVKHTGNVAAVVKAGIKVFPIFIGITLLFVAVSFFIMKKVSGRDSKCNMLELMIMALVNSLVVTFCDLFFGTTAEIKKSQYTEFYEDVKLSLVTELSIINCFCMVFLITLCLLVIVNGMKCKKEGRNSTLLYAFRSNLAFIAVVLLFAVVLCVVLAIKTSMNERSTFLLMPAFQIFYAAAGGLCSRILLTINASDILEMSMSFQNVKCKMTNLTFSETNSKWITAAVGLLILFLLARVVLDVARILKNTNTDDIQGTIIELCKYSGGFALITAFITNLFAMHFKATLYIPTYLSELQEYGILNGKSMGVSVGAGSAFAVFFKIFLCTLIVSLLVFWGVKMNSHIMYHGILAKKKVIMFVTVLFVCLPAVFVLSVSEERIEEASYFCEDSLKKGQMNFSDEEIEHALESRGITEEFAIAWDGMYSLMKELIGAER